MPPLSLLFLCVAYGAAQPPGESFIMIFPDFHGKLLTTLSPVNTGSYADDLSTPSSHSKRPYAPGGLVHLDSDGTVLGFRHETINEWPRQHLIINPLNDTVCWIFAAKRHRFDPPGAMIRCAPLANLNDTWDLPEPRLVSLESVVELAFDGVNENWYLTVKEPPLGEQTVRSYVCSYLFDQCLRLDEFNLDEETFLLAAYDIHNRLMFRIKGAGSLGQLEALRLDGSGKQSLSSEMNSPYGLAVDSVTQQVLWLEDSGGDVGLFRIGYDGKNRSLVTLLEGSQRPSLVDAVDGEVFVAYSKTKTMSRVDLSTGEQTTLFGGLDKVQDVPWSLHQNFITVMKVQRLKAPDSQDVCSSSSSDCRDICVPTVVNGRESKSCFCPEGYELVDLACRKKYAAFAVVAAGHELRAVDLQTHQVTTILSDLTNATKLDFFCTGGEEYLLFWVDDGSVFQGQWSPGGPVSHVQLKKRPRDGSRVMEVAVDRASRHVYWLIKDDITYSEGSVAILQMASFQSHLFVKTVFVNSWEDQRDLAFFSHGLIAFLDGKDGLSTLHGLAVSSGFSSCDAAVDGVNPSSLLIIQPLAQEQHSPTTFWVDRASQSIELVPTLWQRTRPVTHPSLSDPRGLDVLRSRLLWLDSRGQLWTADILGGRGIESGSPTVPRMVPGLAGGRAVRVLHPWRQPSEYPACRDGGGCSGICLPRRDRGVRITEEAQCFCYDGLGLAPDQKGCIGPRMLFPGPPIWTPIPPRKA